MQIKKTFKHQLINSRVDFTRGVNNRDLPARNRLRVADLGVGGGGRIWLLTAMLVIKVEK